MSVNYIDKSTGDLIRGAGGGNDILYAEAPIGSIIPYGGTTAPDGFLLCNGDQSQTIIGVAKFTSDTNKVGIRFLPATGFCNGDGNYWNMQAIRVA